MLKKSAELHSAPRRTQTRLLIVMTQEKEGGRKGYSVSPKAFEVGCSERSYSTYLQSIIGAVSTHEEFLEACCDFVLLELMDSCFMMERSFIAISYIVESHHHDGGPKAVPLI